MNKKLIASACLLATGSMHAFHGDLTIFVDLRGSTYFYAFSALCVIAEFIMLSYWLLPKENRSKLGITTMTMNLASILTFFYVLPFLDTELMFIFLSLPEASSVFMLLTYIILYCLFLLLQITFLKTIIESLVARFFLKTMPFKKLFLYIAFMNAITTFFGIILPLIRIFL